MVSRLANQLEGPEAALWAGCLFAVHPVHTEAVSSVVGRAELLSSLFLLLTLKFYQKHLDSEHAFYRTLWLTMCISSALTSTFSKETGAVALALCLLYDLTINRHLFFVSTYIQQTMKTGYCHIVLRRWIYLLVTTMTVLWLRCWVITNGELPWFSTADNPLVSEKRVWYRLQTMLQIPMSYLLLLLYPQHLSFDWARPPLSEPSSFLAFLATILIFISLVRSSNLSHFISSGSVVAFCASFSILTYLPASNWFLYVGFLVAERAAYLPSIGICLLVGSGIAVLSRTFPRVSYILCTILLLSMCLRTIRRNQDWQNDESLYRSGIAYSPAKSLANLAVILSERGEVEKAERAFIAALFHRPNMADVHCNLGNLQYAMNKHSASIDSFSRAVHYRPQLAHARLGLARALLAEQKPEQAQHQLTVCVGLSETQVRDGRGQRVAKQGCLLELARMSAKYDQEQDRALRLLRNAADLVDSRLHLESEQKQMEAIYSLIGETYSRQGRIQEAEKWLLMSIKLNPAMISAQLSLGNLLAKNRSRAEEAESWYQRAMETAPTNSATYLHYGQFLHEAGRLREAEKMFHLGSQTDPIDWDLVFRQASTLRELGQFQEAEKLYKRVALVRHNDVVSLRNYAAILHLNGKLREAEAVYLQTLTISPEDSMTLENLSRLRKKSSRSSANSSKHTNNL